MILAVKKVAGGLGLRQAARQYNVPVETLRRRVTGAVSTDCRPGPPTVLTSEEETKLAQFLIEISDIGFGLTREDVMRTTFRIVSQAGRAHPFQNGAAGRSWFDAFKRRHPNLTLRTAQPLSSARAAGSSKETIEEFFAKLGGICARLNLLAKPMQLFNVDETGISIVHKPGKVVTELGRRNVWGITSAERGKTHTVVTCVSASGFSIPPMIIYPRKRMTAKLTEGALSGTLFDCSDNGWINQELYLRWFKVFIANIPPARPVLLIQDGHGSHISLDVIRLARENDVSLLCLPAHTTHLLQPLDVGVFKSLKLNFSKACKQYISANPGQVVTTDLIALLLAQAWPQSVTPVNAMSGFRKCGIYPLNPGQISDRELAPSRAFVHSSSDSQLFMEQFSQEQIDLFKTRFEEGFDLDDSDYLKWREIYHPDMCTNTISACSTEDVVSDASPSVSHSNPSAASLKTCATDSLCSLTSASSQSDTLSDILSLPKLKQRKQKRRGMNTRAVVITDDKVIKVLEENVQQKKIREEEKEMKKIEREQKKRAREEKRIVQQQEKEERNKKCDEKKQEQERKRRPSERKKITRTKEVDVQTSITACDSSDSDAECPNCGLTYKNIDCDGSVWICCDYCNSWYHLSCTDVYGAKIPAKFICTNCK